MTDIDRLVTSVETVQGFWQMGILWSPLIAGEDTRGTYSVMEQLMPSSAGPPPHVHDHGEEIFYILDGEMAMQLEDRVLTATAGQMVRIPAGTAHAFAVTSATARVLNFYQPAALDLQVAMLGTPARTTGLPPEGAERPASAGAQQAFIDRLHDLATQRMAPQPDLLGAHRAASGDHPRPMP